MKRSNILLILFIVLSISLTSCTDKDKKKDETTKFLNESYEEFILPVDSVNKILLDKYNNDFTLSSDEQQSVDNFKNTTLKVAIPIDYGYLDEIDNEYIGVNIFSAMQLEKDLGLDFDYIFATPEEIYQNRDSFDIISGKNHSTLSNIYDFQTATSLPLSDTYIAINYACFSKDFSGSEININDVLSSNAGVFLPYYENMLISKSSKPSKIYPNTIHSYDLQTLNDSNVQYLLLPENSPAPSYGYNRIIFKNSAYEINSAYAFKDNTDPEFISAVNKTINSYKEKSLNEYKNATDLIKCYHGYYFTQEEKEFIDSHKSTPILTKYRTSSYPASFYDEENNQPNGKLIALLNRVSDVTELKFNIVNSSNSLTLSEILSNLYNQDIELGVGLEDVYDRSFYLQYSNTTLPDFYIYAGFKDSIKSANDIYNYQIGTVEGSAMDIYLNDRFPTKDIIKYTNIHEAYEGLKNGDVDYLGIPKDSFYYLINYYNDFDLKNIFSTEIPADEKFSTPNTSDGALLISIIDKVIPRVNPEQIINANYPLSEIDTVGSYRSIMFYRMFGIVILILLVVGIYFYRQLIKSNRINEHTSSLNKKLQMAFKVSNFSIISLVIDDDHITIDKTLPNILGINDDDIYIDKKGNSCVYIDTIASDYFPSNESSALYDSLDRVIRDIGNGSKTEFQTQFAFKFNKDDNNIRYIDAVITSEESKSSGLHIIFILRDATKEALYEQYEQAVSNHSTSSNAKARISAFKVELSKYLGNTVAYVNIDNFNQINNVYGHRKGDAVINDIIHKILKYKYTVDLYKMNGDEFFVVLNSFDNEIADDFLSIFRQVINLGDFSVNITASIGYFSINTTENITNDEVVNISNFAMLQAKLDGKDQYIIVDDKMLNDYKQTNKLDSLLKSAIADGDIIPFFQPYYNVETNKIVGYETLMRWKTNDGILSPFLFLSIAIKSGDIYSIDILMFKYSAMFLKQLQDEGLADEHFVASSNFTPITLVQVNPLDLVKIVTDIGISPKNITIEVTEQLFASDVAFEHIKLLKSYGFNIALDDFSVGHSSMAYLKRLSVDVLKLDKTLLDDTHNKTNLDIFRTVVGLGKAINAKIISEGVETADEVKVLVDSKVTIGQGYYFAKPNDQESTLQYIKQINGKTTK